METNDASGSSRSVRVLAAVITRGGRWLLCRRPVHKRHGGCWEFPGGKLEPGETLLEAARRELREELAVHVSAAGEPIFRRRDEGSPFVIEFVEVVMEGEPQPLEHDELRWATPQEAGALALAPADRAFVADWRRQHGRAPPRQRTGG